METYNIKLTIPQLKAIKKGLQKEEDSLSEMIDSNMISETMRKHYRRKHDHCISAQQEVYELLSDLASIA